MKKLLSCYAFIFAVVSVAQAQMNIDPSNGNRGQSLPIIISGQNANWTAQGSGVGAVWLMQGSFTMQSGSSSLSAIKNVQLINGNTISANLHIPNNAPTGLYDLLVYAGTSTFQLDAFNVDQGTPSSMTISPSGGQPGDTVSITVEVPGASFKSAMQGVQSVWLSLNGEIINTISNVQVINSQMITADAVIPAGATEGVWDVNLYTNSGMMYYSHLMFEIDHSFSIEEPNSTFQFSIYPNPGSGKLHISYSPEFTAKPEFRIFSLSGAEKPFKVTMDSDQGAASIEMENAPKGVYIVQVLMNGEVVSTRKWVKE